MIPPLHPAPASHESRRSSYLPDFCEPPAVLVVVLISILSALVLALARYTPTGDLALELARTSGCLLWTSLACILLLCRARGWLERQTLLASTAWALGLILGAVGLVSEALFWGGRAWDARLGAPSGFFPTDHAAFLVQNLSIGGIVAGLALRYFYVAHQWRRSVELESRARLDALHARIRPHFLYNSMNTIASLTRTHPVQAEQAVEDLADLFRAALADPHQRTTLREEVAIARVYQRIEQMRLGSRLEVRWDIGDLPLEGAVPSLLLQPLLENAITHGIEPLPDGGTVSIIGHHEAGMVSLQVRNPVAAGSASIRRGSRMALENIRERLDLVFPGQSAVTTVNDGASFLATLSFPLVTTKTRDV